MAQISFSNVDFRDENSNSNNIGFFSLKRDQEEALVRIMHDNVESLDIVTVHNITVGGKQRKINCLRDLKEPLDKCPLCKSGVNVQQRLFIHLLVYAQDTAGKIVVLPQVWERAASYAITLKNLMDNYGTLSDCLFKIKRNGKPGDMNTTYDIMYANPSVYVPTMYLKDTAAFSNYSALGYPVLNKSFADIETFIATGSFPGKASAQSAESSDYTVSVPVSPAVPYKTESVSPTYAAPVYQTQAPQPVAVPNYQATPGMTTATGPNPAVTPWGAPTPNPAPWQTPTQTVERPTRKY